MAGEGGRETRALELMQELVRAPERRELFQTLRRLECALRDRPRFGEGVRAAEEPVRLGQDPTLTFATSAVLSFTQKEGALPRLSNSMFGVFGPNGPLPLHLTEYAHDRKRNCGDPSMARFLDLFHHRLLSLFYRAFANGEPTVQFDRPEADRFTVYVGSLFGLGLPALRNRDPISDRTKLHYAGLLSRQTRDAEGLRSLLQDALRLPVEIEQFVGEWVDLPEDSLWRLGNEARLGEGTIAGSRYWMCDGKVRVALGPMSRKELQALLPGGPALTRLKGLVRAYLGDAISWDLKLLLDKADWKPMEPGHARLGWESWVGRRPPKCGQPQIIFDPLHKPKFTSRKTEATERTRA